MPKRKRKPFRRYFTVAEANALLPELQVKLLRLQAMMARLREEYAEKQAELFQIAQRNGKYPNWEPSTIAQEVHRAVDELHAMGVVIKDIDEGIVDFPHLREGREVFLCWKLGEDRVRYYHELDAGFRSRKRLNEE
ncbi:hypothetical protein HRbin14_02047 [bacterium HR14]|nr:hypothetical protein HRbin14_02047 [bacterium HR14]